jgi:putative hydrolase of the HAD superfamily
MEAIVSVGGLTVSANDLLHELAEVVAEFGSNYDGHYDRMLRRFPPSALGGHPRGILVAAGVVAYHNTKVHEFRAFPGVVEGLRALREEDGLSLGVITEGLEVKQAEKIVRLGIYPYLDPRAVVISDSIGISKPNPKLWLRACAAVDVAPEECIFVGDSPSADIAPARAVGMATVRLRSPDGKNAALECVPPADHEAPDFAAALQWIRETRLRRGGG